MSVEAPKVVARCVLSSAAVALPNAIVLCCVRFYSYNQPSDGGLHDVSSGEGDVIGIYTSEADHDELPEDGEEGGVESRERSEVRGKSKVNKLGSNVSIEALEKWVKDRAVS